MILLFPIRLAPWYYWELRQNAVIADEKNFPKNLIHVDILWSLALGMQYVAKV